VAGQESTGWKDVIEMQVPLLDLKAQYTKIKDEVEPAMLEVCRSQACIGGPRLAEFEEKIAAYCGCKYAVGVSSGTDALLLALMALGVGPGDEVIVPSFTFGATAEVVNRVGAVPVFVDVDPDTYNITAELLSKRITGKTRGVIVVHLFGQMVEMKPVMDLAGRKKLFVIEDACQSIGASQGGIKCGNFGEFGCFSFYPTKNLGCFGDGGLVVTNDKNRVATARMLRNHGQHSQYGYKTIGGNFRMDAIQAAVLNVKLKYLDGWSGTRGEHAAMYDKLLAGLPVRTPRIAGRNVSVYNQYTIRVPKRDALRTYLTEKGIGSGVYYPTGLHMEECFRSLGYKSGDLPVTEQLCREVVSLPVYPELQPEQVEYVASMIRAFYNS
jgi:dTDP-4-amino-4,6-dideoxygalactose transaminase